MGAAVKWTRRSRNRHADSRSGTIADVNQIFAADELGFPNPFNVAGWPTFYGDCPNTSCAWDGDNNKAEPQTHVTFENNTTWVKGDHVLQFGGKAKIEHDAVRELQQAQGSHDLGGSWTGLWDPIANQSVSSPRARRAAPASAS